MWSGRLSLLSVENDYAPLWTPAPRRHFMSSCRATSVVAHVVGCVSVRRICKE